MRVVDVLAAIDRWAPPGLAFSWDKAGLATGSPDAEVRRVLVCLTVTREAFDKARKAKAEMIVAHHPLVWEPLTHLRSDTAHARLCADIASAGVAVYSAHTNLDVTPGGVNHLLAEAIGLHDVAPLFPAPHAEQFKLVTFVPANYLAVVRDAVSRAGAGVIGDYTHCSFSSPGTGAFKPGAGADPFSGKKHVLNEEPEERFEIILPRARLNPVLDALNEAHPYEEVAYDLVKLHNADPAIALGLRGTLRKPVTLAHFADRVRDALGVEHVRYAGAPKRKVKSVAALGGAGGGFAAEIPRDIDVFVTGDVKYHEAVDANERGLAIVDAGHHGTEIGMVPALAAYLKREVEGLKVSQYKEPDPFRAVVGD